LPAAVPADAFGWLKDSMGFAEKMAVGLIQAYARMMGGAGGASAAGAGGGGGAE
jgi:hypothetical protein